MRDLDSNSTTPEAVFRHPKWGIIDPDWKIIYPEAFMVYAMSSFLFAADQMAIYKASTHPEGKSSKERKFQDLDVESVTKRWRESITTLLLSHWKHANKDLVSPLRGALESFWDVIDLDRDTNEWYNILSVQVDKGLRERNAVHTCYLGMCAMLPRPLDIREFWLGTTQNARSWYASIELFRGPVCEHGIQPIDLLLPLGPHRTSAEKYRMMAPPLLVDPVVRSVANVDDLHQVRWWCFFGSKLYRFIRGARAVHRPQQSIEDVCGRLLILSLMPARDYGIELPPSLKVPRIQPRVASTKDEVLNILEEVTPLPLVLCHIVREYFYALYVGIAQLVKMVSPGGERVTSNHLSFGTEAWNKTEDIQAWKIESWEHKDRLGAIVGLAPRDKPQMSSVSDLSNVQHETYQLFPTGIELPGPTILGGAFVRTQYQLLETGEWRQSSDPHGHVVLCLSISDRFMLLYSSGMIELFTGLESEWMDLRSLPGLGTSDQKLHVFSATLITHEKLAVHAATNYDIERRLVKHWNSLYFVLSVTNVWK